MSCFSWAVTRQLSSSWVVVSISAAAYVATEVSHAARCDVADVCLLCCCAEPGPLSPQASGRPPLGRDSSQQIPRVSSSERLQTGTPGKDKAKAHPVQLKPGHKVAFAPPLAYLSSTSLTCILYLYCPVCSVRFDTLWYWPKSSLCWQSSCGTCLSAVACSHAWPHL